MITSIPQASRTGPDTNEVFAVLANPRRRIVLQVLERHSTVALGELATHVARRERAEREMNESDVDETEVDENEVAGRQVTETEIERVSLDLYHRHLPRLADVGFVEFAEESNTVSNVVDPDDQPPKRITLE